MLFYKLAVCKQATKKLRDTQRINPELAKAKADTQLYTNEQAEQPQWTCLRSPPHWSFSSCAPKSSAWNKIASIKLPVQCGKQARSPTANKIKVQQLEARHRTLGLPEEGTFFYIAL